MQFYVFANLSLSIYIYIYIHFYVSATLHRARPHAGVAVHAWSRMHVFLFLFIINMYISYGFFYYSFYISFNYLFVWPRMHVHPDGKMMGYVAGAAHTEPCFDASRSATSYKIAHGRAALASDSYHHARVAFSDPLRGTPGFFSDFAGGYVGCHYLSYTASFVLRHYLSNMANLICCVFGHF